MAVGYQNLVVWQKSVDLAEEVYSLIELLPKKEEFALSNQMRRAVVSIPSNIAEGEQRRSNKEFLTFLSISRGSLAELETQLILCVRFNYLTNQQIEKSISLCQEIGLMLISLMKTLEN